MGLGGVGMGWGAVQEPRKGALGGAPIALRKKAIWDVIISDSLSKPGWGLLEGLSYPTEDLGRVYTPIPAFFGPRLLRACTPWPLWPEDSADQRKSPGKGVGPGHRRPCRLQVEWSGHRCGQGKTASATTTFKGDTKATEKEQTEAGGNSRGAEP